MSEPVFMFDGAEPRMKEAYESAQRTFKLFWRELYWDHRRIVKGLDLAVIKLPFTDGPRTDGKPAFEHMWVNEIDFDGETLSGVLMNSPNWLISVSEGDAVEAPFSRLTDWMMTVDGRAYGGYTVNLMRSRMNADQRRAHDEAWGLDFGDPAVVRTEIVWEPGKKQPPPLPGSQGGFRDHPMCTNMLPKIEAQIRDDPSIANSMDDRGWALLHNEALAGNLGLVRLIVRYGAGIDARTPDGKSAADLARTIGWDEVAFYLENEARVEQAGGSKQ